MPNKGLTVSLLILLVVNALLIAAASGAFGPEPLAGWMESPREPQRMEQQVRRERMDIVPASEPAARPGSGSAPRGSLGATGAAATRLVAAATGVCLEMGGFTATGARRATEALGDEVLVEAFEREQQVRWWVHLPAQATRENADRKLAELRRRNVTDVAVISSGASDARQSFTVSLGLFHERERAERYLEMLRAQGVRTALISDAPRAVPRQWLRVRRVDDALRARLEEVRQRLGAEDLQACALAS
ncbi:SPOR domain-containing protein [Cupriavidus plantarum]|uniref:SPOR domain-containing protein n=1 Tax=Cupriavidus plantarum TaxID=942865 RepID=UPI0015CD783E|nr:SPOR domain-containing protein [Cupriavidus plantarum]NYH97556.1 cell division septation protein DedD [Cupriavidus plantarum]